MTECTCLAFNRKSLPTPALLPYLFIWQHLQNLQVVCFLKRYKHNRHFLEQDACFSPANFTIPAIQKTLVGRLQSVLGTSTLTFSEISPQQVPIGACHIKITKLSSY